MKIQVPFLTVCLVGLTNLELVLGAPSPFPGIAENTGDVAALGHKSYITGHPVQYSEGHGPNGYQALPHEKTPQERWLNKKKHSRREKIALSEFTGRPQTIEDVKKIPTEDLHKIKHQDHLSQLDAKGTAHLANRLVGELDTHFDTRRAAYRQIQAHGGEPGKMGTGSPEAQPHHKMHADAQKAMNELNGPLKAVEHAANRHGDIVTGDYAYGRRLGINNSDKSAAGGTNEAFDDHVGKESVYHSYGKLPGFKSQITNSGNPELHALKKAQKAKAKAALAATAAAS